MSGDEDFKVTPFEVKGETDYDKLIDKFGTEKIDRSMLRRIKKHAGCLHKFFRRKYCYSHRDMDKILDEYESGEGFYLYTGIGPSSKMHIGHLTPMMLTKWMQDKFDVNLYVQVTDDEKYWLKDISYEEIQSHLKDNLLNVAAMGFDLDKTFVFKNTEYMGHMYDKAVKVAKKINYSNVKAVFGFEDSDNIGSIFWPAVQIVPTMFEKKRCLIPAAIDQDNYWRLQRDIASKLGYKKTAAVHTKFLPGLKGPQGKMSSSEPSSTIYLDQDIDEIPEKVNKYAYSGGKPTLEEHREKGGDPGVDTAFQWLHIFLEDDDKEIERIKKEYESGEMLTGELKQIMSKKLQDFLEDFQRRRKEAEDKVDQYMYEGELAQKMWNK